MPPEDNRRDVVYRDSVMWAIDAALGEARKERPTVAGEAARRMALVVTKLEEAKLWLLSAETLPF